MQTKLKTYLYGFNDFKVINPWTSLIETDHIHLYELGHSMYGSSCIYPITNTDEFDFNNLHNYATVNIKENKAVLDTAKSLYVHPTCKISRGVISQKYKKSLNPWLADGVVIPENNGIGYSMPAAIFINEPAKMVVLRRHAADGNSSEILMNTPRGTKLRELMRSTAVHDIENEDFDEYSIQELLDAEFDYFGPLAYFEKKDLHILDYLTGAIPKSKIVFEKSVLESLGNADNKPTLDNLISIAEMLDSTDKDIVASAIKALSMMDYAHYPNSVIYILDRSINWFYNSATHSTAAKFMFNHLLGGSPRRRVRFTEKYISQEDYELFHKLVEHFKEGNSTDIDSYIRYLPFVYEDENLNICPRIKA